MSIEGGSPFRQKAPNSDAIESGKVLRVRPGGEKLTVMAKEIDRKNFFIGSVSCVGWYR